MQDVMSDQACIRALLKQALEQETLDMKHDEKANLAKLCEDVSEMLSELHSSAPDGDATRQDAQIDDMDLQALELYHQVRAADERVRALRREVPGELFSAMKDELHSFRPAPSAPMPMRPLPSAASEEGAMQVDGTEAAAAAPAAPAAAGAAEAEPGPAAELEAWRQLTDVTNKVPALMARLDHTLQRLTRIISITEADANRPSPRTVEKALFSHRQGSGKCLEELDQEAGAENTRQRLAYDLAA